MGLCAKPTGLEEDLGGVCKSRKQKQIQTKADIWGRGQEMSWPPCQNSFSASFWKCQEKQGSSSVRAFQDWAGLRTVPCTVNRLAHSSEHQTSCRKKEECSRALPSARDHCPSLPPLLHASSISSSTSCSKPHSLPRQPPAQHTLQSQEGVCLVSAKDSRKTQLSRDFWWPYMTNVCCGVWNRAPPPQDLSVCIWTTCVLESKGHLPIQGFATSRPRRGSLEGRQSWEPQLTDVLKSFQVKNRERARKREINFSFRKCVVSRKSVHLNLFIYLFV